ncbi:triple tyrosine motif-containing protein [Chryseosolibacter indicus]|uniref:Two component regulator three Y domain-containing protein n=1 Tax=Chryseosolibacter indicus TaxID=2782351 RepID=A0ABS5W062_9BACT|nr:triple tyrosine motif-containing protein [Chryseosolibacter indicus]MBT1706369.1 hypothetical protein [Chryseosolibacter indicus]
MKKWALISLILFPAFLFAQTGNFFLSHFTSNNLAGSSCYDIKQDARGVMYFATDAGIFQFDGRNWDLLDGGAAVYSLQIAANGTIYWAGSKGYGSVGVDSDGFLKLKTESDSSVTNVFQSLILKDDVFFLNDNAIYIVDINRKIHTIKADENTGSFTGLFELFGAVYVNTLEKGLFKINRTGLVPSKLLIHGQVIFAARIENKYIVGTAQNKLFSCNENLQIKQLIVEDQNFINASVIIGGNWVNKHLLALGTLRGGVVFVNPTTGKTVEIVNYLTGLPDNEVFAISVDRHKNIWVAHEYGYTRVSPYMPLRSFSYYPGLKGNLLCTYTSENGTYVGTSLGLFKLKKEDVYEELVYYVDIPVEENTISTGGKRNGDENSAGKVEPKRRGLFNFLKKNKSKEVVNTEAGNVPGVAKEKPRHKRVRHTEKLLRSSQYVYQKVAGINSKITSIITLNKRIIASGLAGVFEVNDLNAKALLEEPVRFCFASQCSNVLLTSTYENEVKFLIEGKKDWQQVSLFNIIDDQINYMFEAKPSELWLCGADKIYSVQVSEHEMRPLHAIDIVNSHGEATVGVSWDEKLLFVNAEGFFNYNRQTKKLEKVDTLPGPKQYFVYDENILYRDQHGWQLKGRDNKKGSLHLLNLFQDFKFITGSKALNDLWMISRNNELYKMFGENIAASEEPFPIFIKSINSADKKTNIITNINLSEDHSAIAFEIVQPDYVGPHAIEFRYMLSGMKDQWSDWSNSNNKITFPFLPPGDYVLQVQSRNIFGDVSTLKPLTFEVLPPYWKRSWFYALEFMVLASLVILSFRLNNRYRIVSRILSLLTIILLIEFIQTIIDSSLPVKDENPVIDFIIQVFIALLILPVEGYLRNLMFRSMDTNSKLYQLLSLRSLKSALHKEQPGE